MTSLFICDDQPFYINALKIYLKRQKNIKVIGEATDGVEAFSLIQATNPNICLIDLSMPKMDGVSLIEKLNSENPNIKKIVLSQNSGKQWLDRLISNEIDAFILKTDEKEHIINAVEAVTMGEKYFSPAVASIFYKLLLQTSNIETLVENTAILSKREQEVAIHTSKGLTVKVIATRLGCSENTIKTHRTNLMRKIEARNAAEVTAWVFKNLKIS